MADTSYITVTDLFCGAGGSSQGVRRYALRSGLRTGLEVSVALNHWELALETHNTNFPDTFHHCTDIQASEPKWYPTTTVLIASPECTNHSVAKGRKQVKAQLDAFATGKADPAAERSRATMWDVVRFAEYHKYKIVITENVVDARAWVLWDAWIMAMHNLGYHHQCVFYNSMFAWPTPQSRDRMYVVFWRKGQRKPDLDLRPWAPCPEHGPVQALQKFKPKANVKAKYGTQYVYVCPHCARQVMPFYYAAINAIDWTVPAERIGDRKKPLEERTMQRIAYGLKKYGNRPLSVSTLYGERLACRVKDACESPLFGQHSSNATAVAMTFMVETKYSHAGEKRAKGADAPLRTQSGQDAVGVALPFILDSSFTKAKGEYMNAADEPIGTQTTTQSKGVVLPSALMMSLNYPEQSPKQLDAPMDTVTANRPMALMVDTNYFTDHVRPMDGVLPVQTSANKMGIVSPLGGDARRAEGVAFLAKLRGTGEDQMGSASSALDQPVGTLSAGGIHHALITGRAMGFLAPYYGEHGAAGLDDAIPTLRTKDSHSLVVGQPPRIEDLYFRMLKAHEVQAGMAFDRDYVVLGNQREKVKQLGNAVTPPVMELLVERCVQSLM